MRARFECVPCGADATVSVLDVDLKPVGSARLTCPACGARGAVSVSASQWWELLVAKSAVLDELAFARAELDHVRTPADIGGGL